MLELRGGDATSIEEKTFSECSPEQLGPTLSAFASKPGGGVILLRHRRPIADAESVRGSSILDLEQNLVSQYLASARETTPRLVDYSDEEILYNTGVVADRQSGELSVAGLYALGEYPQRLLPHLTLTAAVEGSGDVRAANERLYGICRNVHGRSGRVIEAMGTGIREVRRSLREAGMAEPRFYNNGVSFTVRFPNSALIPHGDLAWLGGLGREATAGLNRRQKEVLVEMRHGRTWSNAEYRERFGVTAEEARSDLRDLVSRGLVMSSGERRWVRYELVQGS